MYNYIHPLFIFLSVLVNLHSIWSYKGDWKW